MYVLMWLPHDKGASRLIECCDSQETAIDYIESHPEVFGTVPRPTSASMPMHIRLPAGLCVVQERTVVTRGNLGQFRRGHKS